MTGNVCDRSPAATGGGNAHGALFILEKKVTLGQKIVVMNPMNWDECFGEVASVGSPHAGMAKVGIEFIRPAPQFWSVAVPPSDWNQT